MDAYDLSYVQYIAPLFGDDQGLGFKRSFYFIWYIVLKSYYCNNSVIRFLEIKLLNNRVQINIIIILICKVEFIILNYNKLIKAATQN